MLCCLSICHVAFEALIPLSPHRRMGKFKLQQVLWQVDQFVFIRVMRRERARKQLIIHSNFFLFLSFLPCSLGPFCAQKCTEGDGVIGAR